MSLVRDAYIYMRRLHMYEEFTIFLSRKDIEAYIDTNNTAPCSRAGQAWDRNIWVAHITCSQEIHMRDLLTAGDVYWRSTFFVL